MPRRSLPECVRQLEANYPALAWTLGEPCFERLCERFAEAGEKVTVARLLLTHDLPDGVPARLAADLEALERAVAEVVHIPAVGPRADADAIGSRTAVVRRIPRLPAHGWENVVLVPIDALRIVPLAFRLDAYLRRVEAGRRPRPPSRGQQTVVVYRAGRRVLRLALAPDEGLLVSALSLGVGLGPALEEMDSEANVAEILEQVAFWIGEGIFERIERRVIG